MSAWLRDDFLLMSPGRNPAPSLAPALARGPGTRHDEHRTDLFDLVHDESSDKGSHPTGQVTPAGADWLASADSYPRSTLSLWAARPTAPGVLPCGSAFDVVNAPAMFGRRMLDRLWGEGPGSGPVAVHRGRTLLFAAPGTAQRLPALLSWEEWGSAGDEDQEAGVPPLMCHGVGDAVTVPPLTPGTPGTQGDAAGPRWVVAPDTRHPWLPGPEVLLWACVRAVRSAAHGCGDRSARPS